ncbi:MULTISPECIES: outer membrane protein [unclassified Bradyrhizobium]|uniref:outer membrane protein n=1 Tax=unclassified Bradyrhizobium TaxID=2631580 RepID=UPI00037AF4F7|nr:MULTISPECIES: outer membrane beta-barrel protein [unclassified Bradyrhizobium]MBB4261628.1 opacity protein-like surface antigen [Bradyrhizobium sp. CIR3A]MBB4363976.1 opacity protein-like surface antigen [Bradyrhizobium sp. CIR18]MBB4376556.1 opacity protein-like surface antigen [Bradyrhizobium sp. SBR1B]MBB4396998.1 opacity protein-like surface antigen [Bradyrhizobium sp. ERR14]MBB4429215.1 opacity protein-like surface antigen [Bradyrhizobium sp. CIR48]
MRGLLLAAAMLGTVSAAHAADMPDLPILRGSFTDGLTRSSVNWQGSYIGAQAGYGSSDENFNGSTSNMMAALLADTLIESSMGVSQWNLGLGKASQRTTGYGAFVGYNAQWDDVVLGLEVSWLHGRFGGSSSASERRVSPTALSDGNFHDVTATSTSSISISDIGTFRGRAAYAWGCFLPYMFAGLALGNADIVRTVSVQDRVSATQLGVYTPLAPLTSTDAQHNHLIYGYTAGLGVDVNLVGGLFMRAEYEYIRFTSQVDTSINTVRAGLGYKF